MALIELMVDCHLLLHIVSCTALASTVHSIAIKADKCRTSYFHECNSPPPPISGATCRFLFGSLCICGQLDKDA